MNRAWLELLADVLHRGSVVAPRGQRTLELLHRTTVVNMRQPVLTLPQRKLSYQFMAAEAYWILTGDETTAGIVPWNKEIGRFSDDGEIFYGAYGPRFRAQLDHVVQTLLKDPDSRQAVLTLWRPNPPASKDVPCTVAMAFSLRGNKLHNQVFMRSNDAWLGTPYDVFNFTMAAHLVCCRLNYRGTAIEQILADESDPLVSDSAFYPCPECQAGQIPCFQTCSIGPARLKTHADALKNLRFDRAILPGDLYLTAASAHLYETNWEAAKKVLAGPGDMGRPPQPLTPDWLYTDEARLLESLKRLRDTKPGDPLRWWETKDG